MTERFVQFAGTISITSGTKVVTGTGTNFAGRDLGGAQLWCIPDDAVPFKVGTVAEVDPVGEYENLELPLVSDYNGPTLSNEAYELVDSVALIHGATPAAILARFNQNLQQNAGLVFNAEDEPNTALMSNNSIVWDGVAGCFKQWRNGVLAALAISALAADAAALSVYDTRSYATGRGGIVNLEFKNAASEKTPGVRLETRATTGTNGAEVADFVASAMLNGSLVEFLNYDTSASLMTLAGTLSVNAGAVDEVARFTGTGSPYISIYDGATRRGFIGGYAAHFGIAAEGSSDLALVSAGGSLVLSAAGLLTTSGKLVVTGGAGLIDGITLNGGGTSYLAARVQNTGGYAVFGVADSAGTGTLFGGLAYASFFGSWSSTPAQIITNGAARLSFTSAGIASFSNTTAATAYNNASVYLDGGLGVAKAVWSELSLSSSNTGNYGTVGDAIVANANRGSYSTSGHDANTRASIAGMGSYHGAGDTYRIAGIYGWVPTGGHGYRAAAGIFDRPDINVRVVLGGNAATATQVPIQVYNTNTTTSVFEVWADGTVVSNSYIRAAAASGIYLDAVQSFYKSGNYHVFRSPDHISGYLGNASEPTNYWYNTAHVWAQRSGSGEWARLNSTGFGIGIAPSYRFHASTSVSGDYVAKIANTNTNGLGLFIELAGTGGTSNYFLVGNDAGGSQIIIYRNGNIANTNGTYGTISARDWKRDIARASDWTPRLLATELVDYNLKSDPVNASRRLGVVIGGEFDVEAVWPELVNVGINGRKEFNYYGLIVPTVQAVQMLHKTSADHAAKIAAIERHIGLS